MIFGLKRYLISNYIVKRALGAIFERINGPYITDKCVCVRFKANSIFFKHITKKHI